MNRKKGVVLIETLIIITIVMLIIVLFSKQNFINIKKSKYYFVKDDICTLSMEEEELIYECLRNIHSNEKLLKQLREDLSFKAIPFKYTYSKDNCRWIEAEENIYLIHKSDDRKKYRKLELEFTDDQNTVIFIPTPYKTGYIKE